MVESRHRGDAVITDAGGTVVHAWGEMDRVVYPRSSIKPLQALVLLETGAADAYDVSDAELALAAASHGGTPEHTAAARAWLGRLGLGAGDLECGGYEPMDETAAKAMVRAGDTPGPLENNCSGKHTGILATALHQGEPTGGYTRPGHPAQTRLKTMLEEMGACDLARAPTGTDGCGIPVYGMALNAMARALARMADPAGLDAARAGAAARVIGAMTSHPEMVAGPDRFDTMAIEAARGAFVVKGGAEGMYGAILPGRGLGVALKIDDGAKRASEAAMAAILKFLGLLDGVAEERLKAFLEAPVTNARGDTVGAVRMAPNWDR